MNDEIFSLEIARLTNKAISDSFISCSEKERVIEKIKSLTKQREQFRSIVNKPLFEIKWRW